MGEQFEAIQGAYNAVDTAETAWLAYKDACIPKFDAAYNLHGDALKSSKLAIQNREEQGWKVLSLILGVGLGAWVPKILSPVQSGIDELTARWVKTTLTQAVSEDLKEGIKGTSMETMKNWVTKSSSNSFEPVVEKTLIWGARFGSGVKDRSLRLKKAILEVQARSNQMTVKAARQLEFSFKQHCPFVVDQPDGANDPTVSSFSQEAELEMWAEWARARDKKWWSENSRHRDLWDMYPIMDRMFALGVDVSFWHPGKRSATIGGTWIRPGYVLDMVKMIEWAERRWLDANTCKPAVSIPPQLRLPTGTPHPACGM